MTVNGKYMRWKPKCRLKVATVFTTSSVSDPVFTAGGVSAHSVCGNGQSPVPLSLPTAKTAHRSNSSPGVPGSNDVWI